MTAISDWTVATADLLAGTVELVTLPTPSALECETVWNDAGSAQVVWDAPTGPDITRDMLRPGRAAVIVYRAGVPAWSGVVSRRQTVWDAEGNVRTAVSAVGLLAHVDKSPSMFGHTFAGDRAWIAGELVRWGLDPIPVVSPFPVPISTSYTPTGSASCVLEPFGTTYGARLRQWVTEDGGMIVQPVFRETAAGGVEVVTIIQDQRLYQDYWRLRAGRELRSVTLLQDASQAVSRTYGYGGPGAGNTAEDWPNMLPSWRPYSWPDVMSPTHLQHLTYGQHQRMVDALAGSTVVELDPRLSGVPDPTYGFPRLLDPVEMAMHGGFAHGYILGIRWSADQTGEGLTWRVS